MYFSIFDIRIWITTECLGGGSIPLDRLPRKFTTTYNHLILYY